MALVAGCSNQPPAATLVLANPTIIVTPSQTPSSQGVSPTETSVAPPPTAVVGNSTAAPTPVVTGASVMIDVESGSTKQTITPNQTAFVPAGSSFIYVLAHFPYPVDRQTTRAAVMPPSTLSWQVEVKNPPTADTYAFGLRGSGSGYMTIQIAGAQSIVPIRFAIQVGNGMSSSTVVPGTRTITLADRGQTITLRVGDRFLLDLGEGYAWSVDVDNPTVISRVVNVTIVRGAQGLYAARQPGRATLTATGDPPCRQAQPPCAAPSLVFQIQVVVQ